MLRKQILLSLAACLFMEAASALTLYGLGLRHWPYPWSFLVLLQYGYYHEVGLSFIVCALPLSALAAYFKKGFARYLSFFLMGFLGLALLSFMLGALFYQWFMGEAELTWLNPFFFLSLRDFDGLDLDYFYLSEVAAFLIVFLIPCYFFLKHGGQQTKP